MMRGNHKISIEDAINLRYVADIVSSYAKYNRINRFELPAVICIINQALFYTSDNMGAKSKEMSKPALAPPHR